MIALTAREVVQDGSIATVSGPVLQALALGRLRLFASGPVAAGMGGLARGAAAARPWGLRSHKRVIFDAALGRRKRAAMKNEPQTSPGQALALERFAFITQIQLLRQGFPLSVALEQAQAHLAVPVKVLYRRWQEQDPQLPSLNSIYRFLREHELHTKARRAQLRQPLGGATKCFEAPLVNELWMTDFSPGPHLQPSDGGKAVPTFLCVIIDDHSRLIPYAAYYLRADTQAFHQTLKEALRRRGVPAKPYTDQGVLSPTTIPAWCVPTWASDSSTPSLTTPGRRGKPSGYYSPFRKISRRACACPAKPPIAPKNSTPSSPSGCRASITPAAIPAPA